ncbi:MAG: hypothetical protein HOP03_08870 [Lysobacter sp.]|nr:hypothetical protein [Lysobacter sp.]
MIKRFLPLALVFAWAPMALAFPPCPNSELQLLPLGSPVAATELWLQAEYVMWGNEDIIDQLKNPNDPRSKCKDRLPVPDANTSDGTIQLSPAYASLGGFGIISLPELPFVATDHLHLQYALHFTVDNALLARTGDWIDLTQLEFAHDIEQANPLSAVYRVRKIQRGKGPATLEVIESRADIGPPYTKPPLSDRVVAQIPLVGEEGRTAIALRWTQFAQNPIAAEIATESTRRFEAGPVVGPPVIQYNIDSVFEVLGSSMGDDGSTDKVLYSISLPRQWADRLSMGLLDYNVPDDSQYGSEFRLVIDDPSLSAKTL